MLKLFFIFKIIKEVYNSYTDVISNWDLLILSEQYEY